MVSAAGGEVLLDQRVRRAGSHHQKLVVLRHPGRPERDVAFAGGIDLCHARRDDGRAPRRPAGAAAGPGVRPEPAVARRAARAARPGRRCAGHGVPRALDRPALAGHRQSRLMAGGQAAPRRPRRPTRCPSSHPDPEPAGPCRVQVLRTYPAIRPRTPYAPQGRALRRARLRQGLPAGPAADLPRGPVHVVAAHRRSCSPTRCAATRGCTWSSSCRATPTSTAGSRCRPTRSAGCRPSRPAAAPRRTGCTCSTWRTTRAPRSTCTPRSPSSTTCGRAWAAPTSTGARGATTASCPARVLDDTRDPREPGRPGRARRRRPPLRPRPAPHARPRAPRPARGRQRGPRPARSGRLRARASGRRPTGSTPGTGPAGAGPRPPGRLRPHQPESLPLPVPGLGGADLPPGLRPGRAAGAGPAAGCVVSEPASAADVCPARPGVPVSDR